ncbi:TPA: hypothetical protein N5O45_000632 [Enterobacter kobei]|uniref:hypothetical protein n=1 Tax=Enterobacter TaxID=547 RepID=UPI000A7A6F5B|nr:MULTISPECIES: hypothetical protein [Enterobacter]ELJ9631843.1 hypothetical protein [Enterobacter hormaechei]ELT0443088.1 hypothetical protein [Enterobacter hormaechei subsp. xiangfangensis]ELX8362385.1 hypothetical protein [Enterobacter hormaechei]MBJ6511409.1 hypothetical protein [Enterobacter hormaechei]MBJ6608701.1 hypothetical protein [Enterobacter hormaechei]
MKKSKYPSKLVIETKLDNGDSFRAICREFDISPSSMKKYCDRMSIRTTKKEG